MIGLGALGALAAIVLLVSQLGDVAGGSGDAAVDPGGSTFDFGDAADLADTIAADGPLLLPDASPGGERDVWLQHVGDVPDSGWLAFAVRPDGSPRDCFADWNADQGQFVDTCDGTTYPPEGEGLKQYSVSITAEDTVKLNLGLG